MYQPQDILKEDINHNRKLPTDSRRQITMSEQAPKKRGNPQCGMTDQLQGAMNADDFCDYIVSFLFLRNLSDNYEAAVKKELKGDYPDNKSQPGTTPLKTWYASHLSAVAEFERQMRRNVQYVIEPQFLWTNISEMARLQDGELLRTLQKGFDYIGHESFDDTFNCLFSDINLNSEKLGKTYTERNAKLCNLIGSIG
jgi:type I restriction enzyme M protein